MIVGEGGADGFAHFKATVVGEHLDLGRRERVVFRQFEQSMVEAFFEFFLQVVEAEVVDQLAFGLQQH